MFDEILAIFNVKTILIGLLTGYVVHWLMQRYKYKLPPGPFPLPLIGNILKFKTGMIHEEAYEMSKTYGPVLSIYVGPMLVIFINDIESAMEVLVKRGTDFANKFRTTSINVFSEGGRDIAFADYGPTWRVHRKIAAKALRHYMQGQALEDRIHDALATVHDEMKKEVKPFDPGHYMDFIVGNILIGLCFGGKYKYKDPELIKVLGVYEDTLHAFSKGVIPEDIFPPLQYFWESSKMKKLKHAFDEIMNKFLRKKYYEHVETFDKGNIRDFTDTLILARKEVEEDTDEPDVQTLTDTHIIQILLNLFFGGIDTSRYSLRFALLHMAAYPDIQEKVQAEIDSVIGIGELPKMIHRPKLPYTEAVLYESMRLASVIPYGAPHQCARDSKIGPYDVPKNTMVVVNYWALHHDPTKWERVEDFIPERYLDETGKLGPKPENWLPFSAGRRVCLGETVAKPELHLIFAYLLQQFTWQLPEGVKPDLSPMGSWFSLNSKPHKFIVKERKR